MTRYQKLGTTVFLSASASSCILLLEEVSDEEMFQTVRLCNFLFFIFILSWWICFVFYPRGPLKPKVCFMLQLSK